MYKPLITAALTVFANAHADAASYLIESAATVRWNAPHPAQKIYGNTYYVGVAGLSSILIDTGKGLILLDGDLVQSVPHIEKNVASLGFHLKDIKYIANSHSHFDHAGGIAELQRMTGATVIASTWGAKALRAGHVIDGDPQFGYAKDSGFPPVTDVRAVRDGETIALGDVKLVAHYTPGHTPGSTTWTWRSCEEAQMPRRGLRRQPEFHFRARFSLHGHERSCRYQRAISRQHSQGRRPALRHPADRTSGSVEHDGQTRRAETRVDDESIYRQTGVCKIRCRVGAATRSAHR